MKKYFGRPVRPEKCLYGDGFSGKSWCETHVQFLTKDLGFIRSSVEGYLYIYNDNTKWIKLINYVDDSLCYSNDDELRKKFEKRHSKKFHLSLVGEAKSYLGMRMVQKKKYISLGQDQYVINITARFEKCSNIHSKENNHHFLQILLEVRQIALQQNTR